MPESKSKHCRLFHAWGLWSLAGQADAMKGDRLVGVVLIQSRECDRCGLTGIKLTTCYA